MVRELKGSRSSSEASIVLSSATIGVRRLDAQGNVAGEEIVLGTVTVDVLNGLMKLDRHDGLPSTSADGYQILLRQHGRDSQTQSVRMYFAPETPDQVPPPPPPPPATGWPDVTNTGYRGALSDLVPMRAGAIRTAGTVIENRRIDCSDGELGIHASNVTLKNCVIDCGVWGIFLYNSDEAGQSTDGLIVEDCTFIGGYQAGIGLSQAKNWRVSRCNFHSGRDAIKPGGSGIVEDCWMHDPDTGGDAHNDCLQFSDCDGIIVRHNKLEGADTSCIAMFDGQATYKNVTVENNHMTGAGYILYAGGSTGSDIRVINNVFGNWGWGPVTDWDRKLSNVWSGNIDLASRTISEPN